MFTQWWSNINSTGLLPLTDKLRSSNFPSNGCSYIVYKNVPVM